MNMEIYYNLFWSQYKGVHTILPIKCLICLQTKSDLDSNAIVLSEEAHCEC